MLKTFCDQMVYSLLGVSSESALGSALNFFIHDSIKIIILLYVMIAVMGLFRTYISPKKIKAWLAGKKLGLSHLLASLFGAVTPFCSCSSIPLFMGFIEAGVPLGPAFSFLVTSPLINEYLVVLMLGFFGLKVTATYVAFGLTLGILSGIIIGKLNMGRFIVEDFKGNVKEEKEIAYKSIGERASYGLREASTIVRRLWPWILLGVGVGALIHGFMPEEAIHGILNKTGALSVPLAVLIGVPIYANCSAVVPVAVVLFEKGVPLGTALAFMMSTAALSLPEAIILRRVMRLPLIAAFFGMVAGGIILVGYLITIIH